MAELASAAWVTTTRRWRICEGSQVLHKLAQSPLRHTQSKRALSPSSRQPPTAQGQPTCTRRQLRRQRHRLSRVFSWSSAILATATLASLLPAVGLAVTFDEALWLAARAPQLRGLERAGDARARLDARLPSQSGNPELTVALGPGGPVLGPAVQLNAAQSWNLGGLVAKRAQAAQVERSAIGAEIRVELLRAQLLTAQAWIGLRVVAESFQLAEQEVVLATELADAVTRSAARGVALQSDAAEALAWTAEAKLVALALEGQMRDASAELATQTALPPRPKPEAQGPWPTPQLPSAAAWRTHAQAVAAAPAAVHWRLLAEAERLRGAEAEAVQASSVSLGGQLQRDSDGTWAVFATAGVRWAALDRGQRAQSQAAEAMERGLGQATLAEHQAAQALEVAEHDVEHAREVASTLTKSLLPALQTLVAVRQESYRRGAGSVVDLLRARRALLECQRRRVGAQGDQTWAEVKAWLLLATLRQEGTP